MDPNTGHIHDINWTTKKDLISVPPEFALEAYELRKLRRSVFSPNHNFSEFREWALEKSKIYSRDKIDTAVNGPIFKMPLDLKPKTKTPRDIRKAQNRKRNKVAKASRKKNRK